MHAVSWGKKIEYIILSAVLLVLLYWHLRLGIGRYYDIDEFAHLHWAFNFFSGMHPYRDYLYFFPPGFLMLLYPLFLMSKLPATILLLSRIGAFGGFLFLCGSLFLLVRTIRDTTTALLTVILLAFLPVPFDKFLEVRPDTIAIGLGLCSFYVLLKRRLFLAGVVLSLGLMVLPKIVFFLPMFGLVAFLLSGKQRRKLWSVVGGMGIPAAGTLIFFFWSGDISRAIYLTTTFASVSSRVLGSKFYMFPSHFFYPNDVYYGIGGINSVLVVNHLLYVIGIIVGILQAAYLLKKNRWQQDAGMVLMAGTMLCNLYAFIKIFPLKHAQYLMLVVPFICFFAAMGILWVGKKHRMVRYAVVSCVLLAVSWNGYQMYTVKLTWNNAKTAADLALISRTIPAGASVWDLFGETIVYKDPYYLCCIPYGQYIEAFGFELPSLPVALEQTNTQYIFVGDRGRLSVLPPDQATYVMDHYEPITSDPLILKKKNTL